MSARPQPDDLASLFELEEVERRNDVSVYRAPVRRGDSDWPSLFGGQVAAQALLAAGATVPSDRRPHSLHGYFLRRGRPDRPVELRVDHDRDGRQFSARHVSALQDGRVIFTMLASFTSSTSAPVLDVVPRRMDRWRDPESCRRYVVGGHVDVRQVTEVRRVEDALGERRLRPDTLLVRVPHPLPDTDLARAAALTYLSDYGTGFGQLEDSSLAVGGPSLDHAVWFHEMLDVHDWILLDLWPVSAVSDRGVYHGCMRDRTGRLGVTLAQEQLLRER